MARIEPVDPATSSGRVRELFDEVEARFGAIPNMAKTMAVSPATLEGWLGLQGALARGRLGGTLGTQIALATAEANGCLFASPSTATSGRPSTTCRTRRSSPAGGADPPTPRPTPR